MATTKNLADSIRRKLASDPDLAAAVDAERFNINVGAEIFEARKKAGLTQKQLAEIVGMRQSAIARVEDADYDGHSLRTLERIAFAIGKRLEIRFVDGAPESVVSRCKEFAVEYAGVNEHREWTPRITSSVLPFIIPESLGA